MGEIWKELKQFVQESQCHIFAMHLHTKFIWKNTESPGMPPKIQNEHTATFHFRPGGIFLKTLSLIVSDSVMVQHQFHNEWDDWTITYRYFFGRAHHTPGSVESEGGMTILGVTTVMDGGRDFKICAIGSINSYYFPYKRGWLSTQ